MSLDVKPDGNIKSEHIHTPITQLIDISIEQRRRMILTIKGMLKKGKIIAANKPIVLTGSLLTGTRCFGLTGQGGAFYVKAKNLTKTFMRSSTSGSDKEAVRAMPKPCTLKEATTVAYSKALRKVLSSSLLARLK